MVNLFVSKLIKSYSFYDAEIIILLIKQNLIQLNFLIKNGWISKRAVYVSLDQECKLFFQGKFGEVFKTFDILSTFYVQNKTIIKPKFN